MPGDLDCPKCTKPYLRGGQRREKHVAECDGTPFKAGAKRPPPRPDAPRGDKTPPVQQGLTGIDAALAELNNRHLELDRQKSLLRVQMGIITEDMRIISMGIDAIKRARRS